MTISVEAKQIDWTGVLERMASTAVQVALAAVVVGDVSSLKTAAMTGLAAGLSVLKNAVKEWRALVEKA